MPAHFTINYIGMTHESKFTRAKILYINLNFEVNKIIQNQNIDIQSVSDCSHGFIKNIKKNFSQMCKYYSKY